MLFIYDTLLQAAKQNWIHWLGHVGGFVIISWLIARGAKIASVKRR